MPEETKPGVDSGVEIPPSDSPTENITQDDTVSESSAGTKTTVENVPFNEMIKNPEFQDFLQRQIAKGIEHGVQDKLTQLGVVPKQLEEQNVLSSLGIDEQQAKVLKQWRDEGIKQAIDPLVTRLQDYDSGFNLQLRASALKKKHNDVDQYANSMLSILNTLNKSERDFVLNSNDGIEYLYNKAKSSFNTNKYSVNTTTSRSSSMDEKTSNMGSFENQMSEALLSGDKTKYEKMFKVR